MTVRSWMRWMQRSVPFAAAALVGVAPVAFSQGQQIFEWTGRVDREVQISMRNNQLATRDIGNNEYGRARTRVFSTLPRQDGQVTVQVLNGRGNVDVVQQPSAQNGFTTIVRIQDRSSGADTYRLAAYWQRFANGDVIGRDGDRDRRDRDRDAGGYGNVGRGVGRGVGGIGNGQAMLHWSGNVDGEIEIRIQNGRIDYRTVNGNQPTSIRADRGNMTSPRGNSTVYIAQEQGRGSVNVIQQPSANNGYTTVIRVRDPQGGYGFYNFDVLWQ